MGNYTKDPKSLERGYIDVGASFKDHAGNWHAMYYDAHGDRRRATIHSLRTWLPNITDEEIKRIEDLIYAPDPENLTIAELIINQKLKEQYNESKSE